MRSRSVKRRLNFDLDEGSTADFLSSCTKKSPPENNAIVINDESTASELGKEYNKVRRSIRLDENYKLPEIVVEGSAKSSYVRGIPSYFSSVTFRRDANAIHAQKLPKHITAVELRNADPDICSGIPTTVKEVQYRGACHKLRSNVSALFSHTPKRGASEDFPLENPPLSKKPRF